MRPRQLTRNDVAFVLEMINEGVKPMYIALAWGMSGVELKNKLRSWIPGFSFKRHLYD